MIFVLLWQVLAVEFAFGSVGAGNPGYTERVSVSSTGEQGNQNSGGWHYPSAISSDGRFVAFRSTATNLVAGGTTGAQVFRRDLTTGETALVSANSLGEPADSPSPGEGIGISSDGRYVSFNSSAWNLTDEALFRGNIFVKDMSSGAVQRVSLGLDGAGPNGSSYGSSLSSDARYVSFVSGASNLVSGDTNGMSDVFVHDRSTGSTTRQSVSSGGVEANGSSSSTRIPVSGDGRFVVFRSGATNLVEGDTNGKEDVFLRDTVAGTTVRASLAADGTQGNCGSSDPDVSDDGTRVVFKSCAALVPGVPSGYHIYVRDLAIATTALVSVAADGTAPVAPSDRSVYSDDPDITGDGRYVAFDSDASNLVAGDTNGVTDVFVKDLATGGVARSSCSDDGTCANNEGSGEPSVAPGGDRVAYFSYASNLVAGDTNARSDVFVSGASYLDRPVEELFGVRAASGYASDPVNTATGNYTEEQTDLSFPGVFGLDWKRTHNSLSTTVGALGPKWATVAESSVSRDGDVLVLQDWDGRVLRFSQDASGQYVSPEEFYGTLSARADGTYQAAYFDGSAEEFDIAGRLVARTNWDTQTVTFAYTNGFLSAASSSTGYALAFSYDASARLVEVSASDGRTVTYGYSAAGALATVSRSDAGTTSYDTDGLGRIVGVVDPDSVTVFSQRYDAHGRIDDQTDADGATADFVYSQLSGITRVKQQNGAVTQYAHDSGGRLLSVTDAFGMTLSKTYSTSGELVAVMDRRGAAAAQTFDERGNLLSRSGPEGVGESFAYDSLNRMTSATDGEGKTTTFAYDGIERLPATVTDPTLAIWSYDVSGNGLINSTTDPDNVVLSFSYDTARNLKSITDAGGRVSSFDYDAAGNRTSYTSPKGHATTYRFDRARRLTGMTDATGAVTAKAWTPGGRLTNETDAEAHANSYGYDASGRLATITDAIGNTTSLAYDADDNLISIARPGGATSSAAYDALGRRVSTTDPTGVTVAYSYDADGNLTTTTDEAGGTQERTYDLRGRMTKSRDELGRETSFAYDAGDRVTSVTDPALGVTQLSYDALGRLTQVQDPRQGLSKRSYTAGGRVAADVDPNGNATTYGYDTSGRLTSTTDATGAIATLAYDPDGNIVSNTSPEGVRTQYDYDGAGRLLTETNAAGGATTYGWTPRGAAASIDPPDTAVRSFTYDPRGQLRTATAANGTTTDYEYDPRGNMVKRTDARLGVETYAYDLADRLVSRTDALARTTTMGYDALGRLLTVDDPSARSVRFTYDAAHQLLSRTFADGTSVSYTYDPNGQRTAMTDATGTTTYAWNATGDLEGYTAGGRSLRFGYDDARNRTSLTYPDGTAANFSFDAANRMTGIAHATAGGVAYQYDSDGRVTNESLPEGVTRTYGYTFDRLTTYSEDRPGSSRTTTLEHDLAGRIVAETTDGARTAYGYDPAGQLTTVATGSNVTTYAYDAVGNRASKANGSNKVSYQYDLANQLTALTGEGLLPGTVTLTHDGAGRMTSANSTTESRTLTYNAAGSLAEVRDARILTRTTTSTRQVDGDGRLVAVTATGFDGTSRTTALTWDPSTAVPEVATITGADGHSSFVYGIGRALVHRGGQGDVFARDAHGSTIAVGSAADLARAGSYGSFGQPDGEDFQSLLDEVGGVALPPGEDTPRFGYRSEMHLDGYVHLRAREYAPGTARFTTVDPLDGVAGEVTVANPYHYANNDPLNQVDPLGLRPVNDSDLRGGWSQSTAYKRWLDHGHQLHGTPWAMPGSLTLELRRIGDELRAIDQRLRQIDAREWHVAGLRWDDFTGSEGTCFAGGTAFCDGYDSLPVGAQWLVQGLVQFGPDAVAVLLGARAQSNVPRTTWSGKPANGVDIDGARFAQTTVAGKFQKGGLFEGRTVDSVTAALRAGSMTPKDVPINVIVRDGNTLILNTRSATALTRAGVPRSSWNVINRTGDDFFEGLLSDQLRRNGLGSDGYLFPG